LFVIFIHKLAQYLLDVPSDTYAEEFGISHAIMHYDRHSALPAQSIDTDASSRKHPLPDDYSGVSPGALMAENATLRSELASVQLERTKLAETQRRIMELLNVDSPDRLVHDIRNILNERALLKALVDMGE